MPKYRIGCSGFLYDSWRGSFYPEDTPQKRWLSFYKTKLKSVELNVTFYRLLKKEAFELWHRETPDNFSFSLKGSRFISHVKKLKDVDLPLLTFFNTTAPLLKKFEVVLWQLPPNFKANLKILEEFIDAIKLYPVRHVFEFRHNSWINKKVFKILSNANMAVCMADWPKFIDELPVTADFVYIRRHGEIGGYATNYTTEQLKKDAKKIKNYLQQDKDVYIYFNNDSLGFAPKNAIELQSILEKSLPKSLKEKILNKKRKAKKPKAKKTKPAKKTAGKIKKKKTVKKLKLKKVKKKKVSKKKSVRKLKSRTKKTAGKTSKKKTKKKIKKKITKKPLKRKTAKKTGASKKKRR